MARVILIVMCLMVARARAAAPETIALSEVGSGPHQLVRLNAAAQLPAVDGSLLQNLSVPSGTWCGNSSSGRRCQGHRPATSCPRGYGQDFVADANGDALTYVCIKN